MTELSKLGGASSTLGAGSLASHPACPPPFFVCAQMSVLRVMHKLLSDRSIRTKAKLPAYQV